jgi:hypothetical protein
MGKIEMLNQRDVCQQCISSFDWNREKLGLSVLSGLDQTIRVMIVTKLNLYWPFIYLYNIFESY